MDTTTPHTMRRAVPRDTRCTECGMTAGTKAHRAARTATPTDQAPSVPAVAAASAVRWLLRGTTRTVSNPSQVDIVRGTVVRAPAEVPAEVPAATPVVPADQVPAGRTYKLPGHLADTLDTLADVAREAGFRPRVTYVPAGSATGRDGKPTTSDSVELQIRTAAKWDNTRNFAHNVFMWCSWTDVVSTQTGAALHTIDQARAYLVAYADRIAGERYGITGDGLEAVYRVATGRQLYGNALCRQAFTVPAVTPVVPAVPAPIREATPVTVTATPVVSAEVPAGDILATVDRKALETALIYVGKNQVRKSLPILSFALVTVSYERVTVSTGDWEITRTVDLDTLGSDRPTCGAAALPTTRIRDWVKALPKTVRTVTVATSGVTATLTAGDRSLTVDTAPVEDLRPALLPVPSFAGTLKTDLLAALAGRGKTSAGIEETVPMLTGIRMVTAGRTVTVTSTDRYRLIESVGTFEPNGVDQADTARLIPAKPFADAAATFARRAGTRTPGDVVYLVGGSGTMEYVGFESDGYRIVMRALDGGNYPPVASLFPATVNGTLTVAPSALIDAVESVISGASKDDSTCPVIIAVAGDVVTAEFGYVPETQRPAAVASVAGTVAGDLPEVIGFNPAYLVELVKSFGKVETVTLGFVDGFKPMVATSDQAPGYRHLIMPIRTTRGASPAAKPVKAGTVTDVHAFAPASIGDKRCALVGCDRGKTARVHNVPAEVPAEVATVDQAPTVPASVPAAEVPAEVATVDQAPAAGEVADQVRAMIAGATWSIETVKIGTGKGSRFAAHVMRPAVDGFVPRPAFAALADQVHALGGSKWNRDAKGFLFSGSEQGWTGRSKSGQERVAEWLAGTADQVPAGEVAADVPAVDQAPTAPASVPTAEVPIGPESFRPYFAQIRGCVCLLCTSLAVQVRSGTPDTGARVLLDALIAGTHRREVAVTAVAAEVPAVTVEAPASVPAVDQVPTVPAAEVPAEVPATRVRLVVPDSLAAPVPAAEVPASVPAGDMHGAHAQLVHVSGRGDVDGYRFHLVAGSKTRSIGTAVRVALGTAHAELGASFTVTAPAKSRTVNVVPAAGATVADWSAALAVAARVIGSALAGDPCESCDRFAALAASE